MHEWIGSESKTQEIMIKIDTEMSTMYSIYRVAY